MENTFDIDEFLKAAVTKGASDIHLRVNENPSIRKDGSILKINLPQLTNEVMNEVVRKLLPAKLKDKVDEINNLDFSYAIEGCSRFRVNVCRQMGYLAIVIRVIPFIIPDILDLGLPNTVGGFATLNNGIVLITGPTGSGKTTTIAAIIEHINKTYAKHIITIEDPIEFIYTNKKAIITQRQLGIDLDTFNEGIKFSLRQDPDVILIGEIRDRETMQNALKAAETGHLVFATLHTTDAIQTINRIINFFEPHERPLVKNQLSQSLRGTISQKLIKKSSGEGRVPALEILVVTATVKDCIEKDKYDEIYELMKSGQFNDMRTMNKSLFELLNGKVITKETAIEASDNKNELELMIRGAYHGTFS